MNTFLLHPLQGERADSGKRWHKAGVEEPLSGAENRRREKIGAGDDVWATTLS